MAPNTQTTPTSPTFVTFDPPNAGSIPPLPITAAASSAISLTPAERFTLVPPLPLRHIHEFDAPHAFFLPTAQSSEGLWVLLNVPGVGAAQPTAINSSGAIVGNAGGLSFLRFPDGTYTTFDPSDGQPSVPVGINSSSAIIGNFNGNGHRCNTDGSIVIVDDPDAVQGAVLGTTATGINDSGAIIGFFYDASGAQHGFLHQ